MSITKFLKNNVSLALIVVNSIFFILQNIIPGFTKALVLVSSEVWQRPWTLLTTMFLHGSFTHLLFNMYALLLFGPLVEKKIGRKRFLFAYFLSGLVASFAALYYPSALGASGAIMGIIGLVIMLFPDLKVLFFFIIPMSMRTAGIIFALLDLVGFFAGGTGVAHLSHLAGLSVGIIYGYYLIYKKKIFARNFTSRSSNFGGIKFTFGKSSNDFNKYAYTPKRKSYSSYEDTIELTKDDLDNYYKYGKL